MLAVRYCRASKTLPKDPGQGAVRCSSAWRAFTGMLACCCGAAANRECSQCVSCISPYFIEGPVPAVGVRGKCPSEHQDSTDQRLVALNRHTAGSCELAGIAFCLASCSECSLGIKKWQE